MGYSWNSEDKLSFPLVGIIVNSIWESEWIYYRKPPGFMGKSLVSCGISLQPIHWHMVFKLPTIGLNRKIYKKNEASKNGQYTEDWDSAVNGDLSRIWGVQSRPNNFDVRDEWVGSHGFPGFPLLLTCVPKYFQKHPQMFTCFPTETSCFTLKLQGTARPGVVQPPETRRCGCLYCCRRRSTPRAPDSRPEERSPEAAPSATALALSYIIWHIECYNGKLMIDNGAKQYVDHIYI